MAMSVEPRHADGHVPLPNIGPVVRELDSGEQALLTRLDRFQAPYLEEKLLDEGAVDDSGDYAHRFKEFKRFASLPAMHEEPVAMTSPEIDAVWHQFILFTPQYRDFCNRTLQYQLDHVPKTSKTPGSPGSPDNFRRLYKHTFGDVPEMWGKQEECWDKGCDGEDWDCHPPD